MDKLRDMRLLLTVVEKGNFAQAAKAVGLTPAMVGRRIAAIEARLGFMLFNRTTRQMELTPGGHTYYEGCKRILSDVRELEESVTSAHQTNPKGLIRITAPDGMGSPFLINAIKHFKKNYPDVTFDINLTSTPLDLIKEKIDLSIRFAFELEDSSLVATKLGQTTFNLYASQDYLERQGTPTNLEDLKQHDCLHLSGGKYGDCWTLIVDGNLINYHQPWALVLPNTECMIRAATEGLGVAMIPTLFAEAYVSRQKLTPITGVVEFPELTIYALYPSRKHLPFRVNLFLDFLKAWAVEELSK